MQRIITTSHVQKHIGQISRDIDKTNFIVVKRGAPKFVILPYFEGGQDLVSEYLKAYESSKKCSKTSLKKETPLNTSQYFA